MAEIPDHIGLAVAEGEGQKVEFKASVGRLDREIVAFANASGGSILLGVDDDGKVVGIRTTNELKSQIHDIARNCDPPIRVSLRSHPGGVLEVSVTEGDGKPHQCKDGFFLRNGPNSQKLTREQITHIVLSTGAHHFDETFNPSFRFPKDLDRAKLQRYLELAGVSTRPRAEDALLSLDVAESQATTLRLKQSGVLFFANDPQRFLRESHITCVRYESTDRFSILDRAEVTGDPITMIEDTLTFVRRNTRTKAVITGDPRRREVYDYPPVAMREAVINAVMHRDYYYDGSHVYVHIFSDRLEVESPGGLPPGLRIEDLGKHSVRRNRLIADLLFRAKYVERIGSGIQRMERALEENGNPPMQISATNFFMVRFYPRLDLPDETKLTPRQEQLLRLITNKGSITKAEVADLLDVSGDTALRELSALMNARAVERRGVGKRTTYVLTV